MADVTRWTSSVADGSAVFTSRSGGCSGGQFASLNLGLGIGDSIEDVRENRRRVAALAGAEPPHVCAVRQVHGGEVLVEDEHPQSTWSADAPAMREADAIASRARLPMAVTVADCFPVVISGSERLAVVHAGWRSVAAGILERALALVGDRFDAAIGPGIGPCCFAVGEDVASEFSAELRRDGFLDLRADVSRRLREGGAVAVSCSDRCTSCDPDLFSYRRDAGATGRQCVLAWGSQ